MTGRQKDYRLSAMGSLERRYFCDNYEYDVLRVGTSTMCTSDCEYMTTLHSETLKPRVFAPPLHTTAVFVSPSARLSHFLHDLASMAVDWPHRPGVTWRAMEAGRAGADTPPERIIVYAQSDVFRLVGIVRKPNNGKTGP
mmetsp:Transcript_24970/g.62944  ORF Transcript_24970/g.62944 Transcript_24970/m.62944 type:complete len:140 (-) Transcript_24970:72-491(-)